MVTNNKVLTVSYGTFACTLEGFDDSFEAMKAIAEYFRDLAADDRYFGAEPPTPDAEMLTRIAEREIERRVQARHEAGSIVLSAAPAETDERPAEPAPETIISETVQDNAAEAAHDNMIADVISQTAAVTAKESAPEVMAHVEDETDTNNLFEEAYDSLSAADDVLDGKIDSDISDLGNVAQDLDAEADDAADEDSIAAKLRRIRAVVSKADAPSVDIDDFIEDQHADDMSAPAMDPALQEDVATAEGAPIESAFEAEPAAPVAEIRDADLEDEDLEEDDLNIAAPAAAPVAEAPRARARVIRMKRSEFEEAVSDGLLEEEEEDDLDVVAPAAKAVSDTSLSDEDEADLMAQLAEVEAEMAGTESPIPEDVVETVVEEAIVADAIVEDVEVEEPAAVAPVRPRRARRAKLDEDLPEDAAVDRLIAEANTKLDEPEGNRRRSAIAHLRAAVAATKAEKEAGSSLKQEDNSEAYRDDLATAMRPRKPASPLKLVAEQRVDTAEVDQEAVRPRRVSIEDLEAAEANEKSDSFIEFAENMGATQLPEVLEAAASYLTFVEGRRRFSRPMLMRLALKVGNGEFEREAGLRSFGQLLRDKKIEKIAGGRFTVSETINFKPDDRAAG